MATSILHDIGGISSFEIGERTTLGTRWTRWLRSFELYADGKAVKDPKQKKALLLHCAGVEVQDIFFTLTIPDPGEGEDEYSVAKGKLNTYFTPKVNITYERSQFRSLTQQHEESMDQFITRLRQKAVYCSFTDVNENIKDQIIEKCKSTRLRRKLLEKDDLSLENVSQIARSLEQSEAQAVVLEGPVENVNKVGSRFTRKPQGHVSKFKNSTDKSQKCFACGYEGHIRTDPKCPAKGKKCRKCKKENHFEKCCKSKPKRENFKKKDRVRQVDADESDSEYAFSVMGQNGKCDVNIKVGGVDVPVIIDSGATVNVVTRDTWEDLKRQKITCVSKVSTKKVYAYGHEKPLTVVGSFVADVSVGKDKKTVTAEFIVVDVDGQTLLGKTTAVELGLLHIGLVNNVVREEEHMKEKFPKLFNGIGKLKDFQLHIPVDSNVEPVVQPLRRVPYSLREKLEKKLDELESLDIIEKVNTTSKWVNPIVVVPKGEDIRLCVDMRKANEAVKRERYPIPTTEEVLQDLNQSTVFSKLDIKMAYHQLEIDDESREITTFMTHKGMYRYKRLMFGVSCAPEMYNKIISQTLSDLQGVSNIFDDIIVHGRNDEEHDARLDALLFRLQEKGLTLNLEKCQFRMPHVNFMGVILSEHGIGMADTKIQAVADFREPQTVSEVKSFLGLVNFSGRFIPNLASESEPLRKLTRKGVPFVWGHEQEMCFNKLKSHLANAENLGYFDKRDKTKIICDAGPVGIGCVLVQENDKGESRVILYASRTLTEIERKYSQTEKEALAIVWSCERLHMYLIGTEFELLTDHAPLQFIFSPNSKPCARVERWMLRLQPFTYVVKHIPGHSNIADPLSRLVPDRACSKNDEFLNTDEYVKFVATEATPVAMSTQTIERESKNDPELSEIHSVLKTGSWYKLSNKSYLPIKEELGAVGYLILRGTRIVVPTSLREEILSLGHEGHPGIVLMKQRLRSKVWWPGMDKDVEKWCKSCYGCQVASQNYTEPEPMKRRELPSRPWEHLSADFMGPLPSGESLLVVVDYYSRWIEVFVLRTTTSEKVINCLQSLFCVHGIPLSLQTDNAQNFNSQEMNDYLSSLNIEHRNTTPYWPQANGEVEIQNKSILKRLRIAHAEKKDMKSELETYLMMYRSTPHSTTGMSPAEMLFRRKIRTKLPDIAEHRVPDDEERDRDSERKGKGKIYGDDKRNAKQCEIQKGDLVLVKQKKSDKLSTVFNPNPMSVVNRQGNSVVVESKEGVRYSRNVAHVKKFNQSKRNQNKSESENESVKISQRKYQSENHDVLENVLESVKIDQKQQSVSQNEKSVGNEQKASVNSEKQVESNAEEKDRKTDQPLTEARATPIKSPAPVSVRPARERKAPQRFSDFVMSKK